MADTVQIEVRFISETLIEIREVTSSSVRVWTGLTPTQIERQLTAPTSYEQFRAKGIHVFPAKPGPPPSPATTTAKSN
jgi:hypothetical protein